MSYENEETEENTFECQYCHLTFDSPDERDNHVLSCHYEQVSENLAKIRTIAEEHSDTIASWRDSKRKELLLKIATENPRLLHEIQGTHGDEILDKMIEESLFKEALRANTASRFDLLWLQSPHFEEVYQASRSKPKHEPQTGQSTGQSEEFFESPDKMIDTTKRTNMKENLSEEDRKKLELVKILFSIMRNQKKKD